MVDEVKDADTLTTAVPADLRLWGHLARPGGAQVLVSTAAISATIEADLAPTVGSSAAAAASSALSAANSATATAADHVSTTASASAAAASAAEAAAYLNGTAALTGTLPRVSRTALKALDTGTITTSWLTDASRQGMFPFLLGDYSTEVAADTCEGIYLKADGVSASTGAWVRPTNSVQVKWFGATGDGSTDDTAALQCAIGVAGYGAVVDLAPGAIYVTSAGLVLLDGQTLRGNGATIKRANQVTTTTTTAMTSGVTRTVTVNDPSGFKIGDQVALSQVGTARSALALGVTLTNIRTITGKSGSTLTLNTQVDCSLSIGSKIFSAYPTVTHADRTTIDNVTFDGNRTNNAWARWETHCEVWETSGAESPLTNRCNITNAPGEGIVMQGNCGTVNKCTFATIGGNGTHFSGATNPRVLFSDFVSGNLDTSVGHVSGAIGWSMSVTDVIAIGCTVDGFARGFGEISDSDNGAKILFCKFKNCYGHGGMISASAKRILVEGCTIENCATDTSKVPTAASYGGLLLANVYSRDIKVINCDIDGPLYVVGTSGTYDGVTSTNTRVILEDNRVTGETLIVGLVGGAVRGGDYASRVRFGSLTSTEVTGLSVDRTGVSGYCIQFYTGTLTDVPISGIKTKGGTRGIQIEDITLAGVAVYDCDLNDASEYGFRSESTSSGLNLTNITARRGATGGTDYIGVFWKSPNANVVGCKALNEGSGRGEEGFYPASTATGSIVTQCITRGSWLSDFYFGDVTGLFYGGLYYDGSINAGTGNTSGGGNINV